MNMMRSRKTLQWFYYLQAVSIFAHNIIRLPDTRQARFVLRHIDRVHVTAHFSELTVYSEQVCADKCVSHSSCKSFNYYDVPDSDDNTCQLVAEDLTDRYEYVARAGWKHFDTGRSMLTRLTQTVTGYCYYPESGSDCNYVGSSYLETRTSAADCDSVRAFFEYDRDTGIIKHYCTGNLVCPSSIAEDTSMHAYSFDDASTCRGRIYIPGDYAKRWRIGFKHQLEFAGRCWTPSTVSPTNAEDNRYSYNRCYWGEASVTLRDIEQGPVRVTVWYGTNYDTFAGFIDYIKGLGPSYNYKYFNDFSWYAPYDIDSYALRMQAIFRAPETGIFTFVLVADDYAKLHIHDCLTCSEYKVRASATSASCFNCVDHEYNQAFTHSMVKEEKYYFEIFFLEKTEGDYMSLYMKTPTQQNWIPVSFNHLEPYAPN